MWKDLELEQLAAEENACSPAGPPEEVEELVVAARLELYNRGRPYGAAALRKRLDEHYHLKPLPSVRTIGGILARQELTHARTGWYEGDQPQGLTASTRRRKR